MVDREIDGRHRRACEQCGHVEWNNPVPVVAAIVEHNGAVLLARNREWPPRVFGLVTGFLEANETPAAAVLREVSEELGLQGRIEALVGHYPYAAQNQLLIVFHLSAEGEVRLGEELAEVRWIPARRLKPWDFGTGPAVADWLEVRRESDRSA